MPRRILEQHRPFGIRVQDLFQEVRIQFPTEIEEDTSERRRTPTRPPRPPKNPRKTVPPPPPDNPFRDHPIPSLRYLKVNVIPTLLQERMLEKIRIDRGKQTEKGPREDLIVSRVFGKSNAETDVVNKQEWRWRLMPEKLPPDADISIFNKLVATQWR